MITILPSLQQLHAIGLANWDCDFFWPRRKKGNLRRQWSIVSCLLTTYPAQPSKTLVKDDNLRKFPTNGVIQQKYLFSLSCQIFVDKKQLLVSWPCQFSPSEAKMDKFSEFVAYIFLNFFTKTFVFKISNSFFSSSEMTPSPLAPYEKIVKFMKVEVASWQYVFGTI